MVTRSLNGQIRVWDTSSGALVVEGHGPANYDTCDECDRLVVWSNASIDVLDATTGQQISTIKLDTRGTSITISTDGERIVVENSDDGSVTIWDATTGQLISTLDSTWAEIRNISVELNRGASRVIVKNDSGIVELFDGSTGVRMKQLDSNSMVGEDLLRMVNGLCLHEKTVRSRCGMP
jgi:WD40 repeat protein